MSFRLTIDVPDNKLISTLRTLNGHKVTIESAEKYEPGWVDPRKKSKRTNPHSRGESLLTMTGKTPKTGSKIEPAVEIFEKLEKKKGIGAVTVQDFREQLVKKDLPKALAQRCVTEKFMAYL